MKRFRDRTDAGRQLAAKLSAYANHPNAIVLGLPRGGVPVAYEVASALHLPLDICLVRKLGMPDDSEFAVGAIAENGVTTLSQYVVNNLHISEQILNRIVKQEKQVLEHRQQLYRENHPLVSREGRTVIMVDDGIATGSTMLAAIKVLQSSTGEAARWQLPQAIVVAVPVAPRSTCQQLQSKVNRLVCLATPYPFQSVSLCYDSFPQTSDEEVKDLLAKSLKTVAAS